MITDTWRGCYKRGWGRELVPEAFSHPAKISFSLAERIYAHIAAEGWIAEDATVLDPFAGIGGCAYHALKHGLHFIGIELEPKFVDLAAQNVALWNRRYAGRFARWGMAQVIQGDSRRLADVVHKAGGVVSSPPFAGIVATQDPDFLTTGEQGKTNPSKSNMPNYGSTPGNLGNLRATDAGFSAAVSSPPYAESMEHAGGIDPNKSKHVGGPHSQMNNSDTRYGQAPGQLAAMRADGFDSAVSSPPYEASLTTAHDGIGWE